MKTTYSSLFLLGVVAAMSANCVVVVNAQSGEVTKDDDMMDDVIMDDMIPSEENVTSTEIDDVDVDVEMPEDEFTSMPSPVYGAIGSPSGNWASVLTYAPTIAPVVAVPTEAPSFKEGDASVAAAPGDIVQPLFQSPVAPPPISGSARSATASLFAVAVAVVVVAAL